jgi:zinc/manganese transport system permease protein
LLLGLLAAPAGASQLFTSRPFPGLWLSGGIAVLAMWGGLTLAYLAPRVPPSFGIVALATGAYGVAGLVSVARDRRSRAPSRGKAVPAGARAGVPAEREGFGVSPTP